MSAPPEQAPLDIVLLLARRWVLVAAFAALGVATAISYTFIAPSWYLATLRVVPSVRSTQESAAASLAAKLPIGIDAVATDPQRIDAVLHSNSVSDEVVKKFRLEDRYGVSHLEQARAELWAHCATEVDRKSNVVTLSCEDKNPKVAMDMASYFGEVGNQVFRRVYTSSTAEERKFLEAQVASTRKDVDDASGQLRAFEEQHKIIDLPEQTKAVISAMASIQGELLSKQLELSYLTSFSSRTEANVMQLQQQIGIMQDKLKQLEASSQLDKPAPVPPGSGSSAGSNSFFPDAMNVPELRFQLEQLVRDQKVKETVFFLTTQRYEMARIDEARDTSTFQILDQPTIPTFRSRPLRKKIAALGLFVGALAGACWVILPVWWRRRTFASP